MFRSFRTRTVSGLACFTIVIVVTYTCVYYQAKETLLDTIKESSDIKHVVKNVIPLKLGSEVNIPELSVGRSRFDNQRILRIYDFHFTGLKWDSLLEKYDICFATQTSLERIYWVPYILERWTGPLSMAVQITSEEEWLVLNLYMSYLTKCHSNFANQVAMHLTVPANLSALKVDDKILSQLDGVNLPEIKEDGDSCPEAKKYLTYLLDTLATKDKQKLKYKEVYPQNHLRNIARNGCGTYWTYVTDVDTIPRSGMADMLQQFYNDQKLQGNVCSNCGYVIPAFEVNDTFSFPETKAQISELFKNGAALQFNFQVYGPSQAPTNYTRWTSTELEESTVSISYEIPQNDIEAYEPFYVSPGNIPAFDERFLGYGSNRRSQFKAAVMSGWKFLVLTPVFSIHWGFQTTTTFQVAKKNGIGESVREEQTAHNQKIYSKFVQELECKKKLDFF